jgi:hypothetical protein
MRRLALRAGVQRCWVCIAAPADRVSKYTCAGQQPWGRSDEGLRGVPSRNPYPCAGGKGD